MPRKVKKETPVEKLQKQISELQEQLQIEKRKETEQKIKKIEEGIEKERKHLIEDLHFEDYALFERDYLHFSRIEILIPIGYLYKEYTESVVKMINLSFDFPSFGPSVGVRQEELPISLFIKKLSEKDWVNYKTETLNKILSYNVTDLAMAVTDKTIQELKEMLSSSTDLNFCSESCERLFSLLNEHNELKEKLERITETKAYVKLEEKEIFKKPVVERLVKQESIYYQDEDGEMYCIGKYCVNLVNSTITFTLPNDDELEYFLRGHEEEVKLPLDQYKKSFWFKEDKSE